MKRSIVCRNVAAIGCLATLLLAVALPAFGQDKLTYALSGTGRALDIAVGTQGLTLGYAHSEVDSTPAASGIGAGQCEVVGEDPNPANLPCTGGTLETSSLDNPGDDNPTCAAPTLPAPLDTVLKIEVACGQSSSALVDGRPTTSNEGKVAEAALNLDLTGLSAGLQDAKAQVIDTLSGITNVAPAPVRDALGQVLNALDLGQAVQIELGSSTSNVSPVGNGLEVRSTASGAKIGVLGIPDLDATGVPLPGTSTATEDGLIIIEVGSAEASASIDTGAGTATSAASPALVTVKIRDITKVEPTYISQSVAPGQSLTVLEGTPAESTITAAASTSSQDGGSASAAADAVRLDLLKGVSGGVHIGLGRAIAAAKVSRVDEPPIGPTRKVLPVTGGRSFIGLGIVLLLGAGAAILLRRRFAGR